MQELKQNKNRNQVSTWVYQLRCKEIEFERQTSLSTPLVSCPSHFTLLHVNYKLTEPGLFPIAMKL